MRPRGTKEALEERRREGVALSLRGLTNREVAELVGCAPASVCRWSQAYEAEGPRGLDPKPQRGSRPRLSEWELCRLFEILVQGAVAAGFPNELWTLSRVREVIARQFAVDYHVSHVHRILCAMGLSCQRPGHVAREQNTAEVQHFRQVVWPAIKKSAAARANHRLD